MRGQTPWTPDNDRSITLAMSWSPLPSARSLRAWPLLVSGEPLCHLHLLRSAKTDVVYSPKRCDDRLNQPTFSSESFNDVWRDGRKGHDHRSSNKGGGDADH